MADHHQSAVKAWEKDQLTNPNAVNPHAFVYGYKIGSKEGIEDFKSSLKRRIEERIEELEGIALVCDRYAIDFQIYENKRFLELLDEVEPNT